MTTPTPRRALALTFTLGLGLGLAAPAFAQEPARLQLPNLDTVAKRASDTVDVTLDAPLLQLAASFMTGEDADEAAVKELLRGLKGIYVKSYEFDADGGYSPADLEGVRSQLGRGSWTRLVNVTSTKERSSSEVYAWMDQGVSNGLAIISAEPRELTIVNIVGRIDLEKLRRLEGQFGIPKMPEGGQKQD
jgi:Domain of unknown function (DUF4252)